MLLVTLFPTGTGAEMCRYECVTCFTIRDLNQDGTMANGEIKHKTEQ
jgi:hypothetical protein